MADGITWTGTDDDDRYVGSAGDDVLDGGKGDDEILSGAGNDTIEGERGNDIIYGGEGNDIITDEDTDSYSAQKLYGEGGDDTITGAGYIYGGDGNDTILANDGNAYIDAGDGDNAITVDGAQYVDRINSGSGDDTITVTDVNDYVYTIYSGDGDDILTLDDRVYSYIYVGGGDDDITLEGSWDRDSWDPIHLENGDDRVDLSDWDGNKSNGHNVYGGSGDDTYIGRDVDKTNNSYDYFHGDDGQDTITGGDADENFSGGNDEDTIDGGYGDDILSGGNDSDTITGGDGADTITGGEDADTLTGGAGQDIFVYNSRNDEGDVITDFVAGDGGDLLDFRPLFSNLGYTGADPFGEGWLELEQDGSDLNINLDRNGGGDSFSDTMVTLKGVKISDFITQNALPAGPLSNDPVTWTGTDADERYVSGGGDDVLDGGKGDDEILSGAGNDTIEGERGNDIIYGGEGNDIITDEDTDSYSAQKLYGEGGDDTITGAGYIYGGDGNDTILANDGNAYIDAGDGDNTITVDGAQYVDRINSGSGNDTITVTDVNDYVYTIYSGDGDDILTLDDRVYSYIYVGGGDDDITLEGSWDRDSWDPIHLENGDDRVDLSDWDGNKSNGHNVYGGSGDDTYIGRDVDKTNNSYDYFYGEDGQDTITGGDADENFSGGNDEDTIDGGYGDDILSGGNDSDTITGGDGADTITGGEDADTLTGGAGQDIFVYNSRNDEGDVITDFVAGDGGDLLDFRPLFSNLGYTGADPFGEGWLELEQDGSDLNINLDRNGGGDSFSDTMVTLKGVKISDFITQNALPAGPLSNDPVTWTGTDADERYVSGGGDDVLDGGKGDDEILAGAGNDTIEGERGNDIIYGGEGNDVITDEDTDSYSAQKLYGEGGDDTITGAGYIYGGDGNDTILANDGNAYIDAGDGDNTITVDGAQYVDRINSGSGNDTITVTDVNDYVYTIYSGDGDDILTLDDRVYSYIYVGGGDDDITLEGSWDRDSWDPIHLENGDDRVDLSDWDGNKSYNHNVYGGSGDDTYIGRDVDKTNNSYDYFYGEDGQDTITGGDADENFSGGNDEDTIDGGYGDDILSGGNDSDTITGGDGADTITGGEDADTLTGGAGQDIFVYNSRNDEGDVITDFVAGDGGDLLDFRPLFSNLGYTGADPFGEGWLELEQDGSDLNINLDRNGGGDNFSDTMVTLEGVKISDFITQNALPAGPLTPYPDPDSEPDFNFPDTIKLDDPYGNLIAPLIFDGNLYYYWDLNGNEDTFSGWKNGVMDSDSVHFDFLDNWLNSGDDITDTNNAFNLTSGIGLVLPSLTKMQELQTFFTSNASPHDNWNINMYWSSTLNSPGYHFRIGMGTGSLDIQGDSEESTAEGSVIFRVDPLSISNLEPEPDPIVNEAPSITDVSNKSMNEDSSASVSFSVSDDLTDSSSLTVTASSSNIGVIADTGLSLSGTGSARSLKIEPIDNASGETTITLILSDGSLETRKTFQVNVSAVNDAPVVYEIALEFDVAESANVNTVLGSVSDIFTDVDGDTLKFSIDAGNTGSVFIINETTGQLKVADALDYETLSSYDLTIKATDEAGASATTDVSVTITDIDETPIEDPIDGPIEDQDGAIDVSFSELSNGNVQLDLFLDASSTVDALDFSLSWDADEFSFVSSEFLSSWTFMDYSSSSGQHDFSGYSLGGLQGSSAERIGSIIIDPVTGLEETQIVLENVFVNDDEATDTVETLVFSTGYDVSGSVHHWNEDDDGPVSLDGVLTLSGISGDSSDDVIQFRNLQTHSDGGTSVELWANGGSSAAGSYDFVLNYSSEALSLSEYSLNSALSDWETLIEADAQAGELSVSAFSTDLGGGNYFSGETLLGEFMFDVTSAQSSYQISQRSGEVGDQTAKASEVYIRNVDIVDGAYSIGDIPQGDYKVDAFMSTEDLPRAIKASDALAALKIGVGITQDATAHQLIAADVTQNGRINSADALEILKMAVGHNEAQDKKFVFVDEDADLSGLTTRKVDYDTGIEISDLSSDLAGQDLVGILLGDVNGNYVDLL